VATSLHQSTSFSKNQRPEADSGEKASRELQSQSTSHAVPSHRSHPKLASRADSRADDYEVITSAELAQCPLAIHVLAI
jgi:hypothetical protein